MNIMLRVFCDFDGTVVPNDVGDELFRTFAGKKADEIIQRFLNGQINARECLMQECAAVPCLSKTQCAAFVDQFAIDPYFPQFFDFCSSRGIPVTVLSDGLDFYVERILRDHGLGHLPWYANHVEFVEEGGATKLVPSFPFEDLDCDYQCGNCKRNHLLTLSGDDDIIVYAGDGISDRCPVRYADIVFAKRELIPFCQQKNISYFEFRNFRDVQERLEKILRSKRIKKHREAETARRTIFMQG